MQVDRARYTPSDIGPSPSDWGAPRLSEVSTLITNGFVGTASPFYSNETGVSYLYGTNVRANKIDLNNLRYITREFHQDQQKTSLRAGDLLTVQSGHIGETAVVPKHLENANCHALIVTRLKPKLVNSNFLCQYINSEIGIARLRGLEVGSTIAHINTKDLKKFRIPLPPLPEQKKIAAILATWDRAIEGTEKLLANSQQQKKALMQQLLTGKKRLLGFTGEWKVNRLGEISSSFTGLSGKTKNDFGSGHKYITYKNVFLNSCVNINDVEYVEIKTNENQNKLQYGDILFTTSSETPEEVGMSSVFLYGGDDIFYLNSFCFGFRPKDSLVMNPNFSQFLFRGEEIRRKIQLLAQGATRYNISKNKLSEISINLPPLPEQKAIATVLSTANEEITGIESDLARLRQEKKALMQQLLTGKRRVTVD